MNNLNFKASTLIDLSDFFNSSAYAATKIKLEMKNMQLGENINDISSFLYNFGGKATDLSIDIPGLNYYNLTNISDAFWPIACYKNEKKNIMINLNDWTNLATDKIDIINGERLFYRLGETATSDSNINLYINWLEFDKLTTITNIFKDANENLKIYVKDETQQNWIYNLTEDYRPANWTREDNIHVYSA